MDKVQVKSYLYCCHWEVNISFVFKWWGWVIPKISFVQKKLRFYLCFLAFLMSSKCVLHSSATATPEDWNQIDHTENVLTIVRYHFGVLSVVLFRSRLGAREWPGPGPARSCTFTRRRDACATRDTPVSNGTEWDEDKLYIIHYCRQQFVSLRTMKQCGHVDKKYLSLTVLELLTSADMSLVKVNSFVP